LGNWYFTPPVGEWGIAQAEDLVALVVFVTVGSMVAWLVSANARRSAEASRARAEAETLARSSAALVGEAEPIRSLVQLVRNVFGLESVAVMERVGDAWTTIDSAGTVPPAAPSGGQTIEMEAGRLLVMNGPQLAADDRRLLAVFSAEINAAIEGRALHERANQARALEEANRLRAALLQSVSHDLRTPLTSIKACVTTLLHGELHLDAAQTQEMLVAVDEEADRLNRVVGNLLDASRLHAGALQPCLSQVDLQDDVLVPALVALDLPSGAVELSIPDVLPLIIADPGLLEQTVVNLLANAVSWSPPGVPARIEIAAGRDTLEMRVVDRGPGIDEARREHVFEPFQRLGDRSSQAGVGLGLSVAEGFVTAMGGSLDLDETPGGGATFTISLPLVHPGRPGPEEESVTGAGA
jgi:two-component system sensor histidine kinase KdpD